MLRPIKKRIIPRHETNISSGIATNSHTLVPGPIAKLIATYGLIKSIPNYTTLPFPSPSSILKKKKKRPHQHHKRIHQVSQRSILFRNKNKKNNGCIVGTVTEQYLDTYSRTATMENEFPCTTSNLTVTRPDNGTWNFGGDKEAAGWWRRSSHTQRRRTAKDMC